jgi:hypothetical protein
VGVSSDECGLNKNACRRECTMETIGTRPPTPPLSTNTPTNRLLMTNVQQDIISGISLPHRAFLREHSGTIVLVVMNDFSFYNISNLCNNSVVLQFFLGGQTNGRKISGPLNIVISLYTFTFALIISSPTST